MADVLAALEAYAPIQRRHRDGSTSDETGDTICRWCHVYAGLDHHEDCPITVARRPNREAAPREATVDHFATQLQETGRATVFDGGEAHAVLAALRAIGAQSFTVVIREAAPREGLDAWAVHHDHCGYRLTGTGRSAEVVLPREWLGPGCTCGLAERLGR